MKLRHYLLLGALFIVPIISPLLFQTVTQKTSHIEVPAYQVTEYHGIKKFPDIQSIHNALYKACQCTKAQLITQEIDGGGVTSTLLTRDNVYVTITTNPAEGFAITCAYDNTGRKYSHIPLDQLFDAQEVITREI
jgi:S-adenosylmethionine/arginine decarboxylase-like enzyme